MSVECHGFVGEIAAAVDSARAASGIDPQNLNYVLTTVHAQIVTALWLSAGMLLAFAAIVCVAFHWRRTALLFGFGYFVTLFFVRNGHALILAPVGCAIALIGLLWPRKPSVRAPAPPPESTPVL